MVVVTGAFELMVGPPVEKVDFPGAMGGPVQQSLTLTNGQLTHSDSGYNLAWKIKCTDNNVIKIDPAVGLLKVGESATVSLAAGPLSGPPKPQNIFIMNILAAEEISDPKQAWAQGPETGKVQLDAGFG